MSTLHFTLFGRLAVRRGDRHLEGFTAAKVQELLGYLLLHRSRPHSREALATTIWLDGSSSQSKKQLRQILWQLQTALEPGGEGGDASLLIVHSDWVSINAEAQFWLDVAVFEEAYARSADVPGQSLDAETARTLASAVQLCDGDLLEGLYADWCLFERERLRTMSLAFRDKLMAYCEANRLYDEGLGHGESILRVDPGRERTHYRLMRLHFQAGDRVAALRQYERCVTALEEELGVRPSKRTTALYHHIRSEPPAEPREPFVEVPGIAPASLPLADILTHLRQLRASFQIFEHQLNRGIQAIEHALEEPGLAVQHAHPSGYDVAGRLANDDATPGLDTVDPGPGAGDAGGRRTGRRPADAQETLATYSGLATPARR